MKQVFVVYETDRWLSYDGRVFAGVFSSKKAAIDTILKNHDIDMTEFFDEEYIEKISEQVLKAEIKRILQKELETYNQTSCYEVNYHIDVVNMNECYLTPL